MKRTAHIVAGLLTITTSCTATTIDDSGSTTTLETITATANDTVAPGGLACWTAEPAGGPAGFSFSDVTSDLGLIEPLVGIHGHAAIWTDANADGQEDLYVGSFADRDAERYAFRGATGPSPDRLLLQGPGFSPLDDFPEMRTRSSGGASADLDGDGDLDLVLSRNYRDRIAGEAPTQILRNDGGRFIPVTGTGLPEEIGGRSVAIFDYDIDGLLDILITEDRWSGGESALLRNMGDLRFEDMTAMAGLPSDVHGLGVAAADFTNDRLTDLFIGGSNRMFIGREDATFVEVSTNVFDWEIFGEEDDIAGVSVADLNRDGWMDLAVGHHFNSTVEDGERVPVRIYMNRGLDDEGLPLFEDVTDQTDLPDLATKAPHVELNDFDNDGWPDLLTSASAQDGNAPALFRNTGGGGDIPVFEAPEGLGSSQYWVAAPTSDFDRDGRLDIFALEWDPALPSKLLRNVSQSGNWIQVSVDAKQGHGLGWRVSVRGDNGLLGAREITATQGYSSGVSPIAHFGLGDADEVTVILEPIGDREPIVLENLKANQHIRYPAGCGR